MLRCMRTTLHLDDGLVTEAKVAAARSGRTLSQLIEDALRQALSAPPAADDTEIVLPTSPGVPRPGVDLDDTAGLLDLMDERR